MTDSAIERFDWSDMEALIAELQRNPRLADAPDLLTGRRSYRERDAVCGRVPCGAERIGPALAGGHRTCSDPLSSSDAFGL